MLDAISQIMFKKVEIKRYKIPHKIYIVDNDCGIFMGNISIKSNCLGGKKSKRGNGFNMIGLEMNITIYLLRCSGIVAIEPLSSNGHSVFFTLNMVIMNTYTRMITLIIIIKRLNFTIVSNETKCEWLTFC